MSAGLVPDGGWVVEDWAVGADGVVVRVADWVDVVAVVVAAIRGNAGAAIVIGEVKGVRRIARRRESLSGSSVLSGSNATDSEGDFGGSTISGVWGSSTVVGCTSNNDISGRSAPRWGKAFPAL